jgi:hypothetical protein
VARLDYLNAASLYFPIARRFTQGSRTSGSQLRFALRGLRIPGRLRGADNHCVNRDVDRCLPGRPCWLNCAARARIRRRGRSRAAAWIRRRLSLDGVERRLLISQRVSFTSGQLTNLNLDRFKPALSVVRSGFQGCFVSKNQSARISPIGSTAPHRSIFHSAFSNLFVPKIPFTTRFRLSKKTSCWSLIQNLLCHAYRQRINLLPSVKIC